MPLRPTAKLFFFTGYSCVTFNVSPHQLNYGDTGNACGHFKLLCFITSAR
jgi:hypothetical protein